MSDSLWDHIEVTAVPFLHIVGEEPIDPALTPGFDYVQSYEWIHPQIATGGAIRWHSGLDQLQRKGVTAIVSGRSDFDDRLLAEGHEIGMDFLYNPTADDGNVKPATWFKAAIDFCMPHLHRGERVFLHCHGGVNRGPSMAYAVLRAYTGWDHERAFHAIVSVRSIAFVSYAYDADLALHDLGYTSHTTPGLARTYKHPGDESLVASRTAARRDNLTQDDAPRQQPMKANIKPAQRKKPSADQKKFRRAQTRKQGHVEGCPECGSTDATPDENHKDEYRCNYCGTVYQPGTGHVVSSISAPSPATSTTSTTPHPAKEASMTSNPTPDRPTEADLLTRLATATTLADQTRIAGQIEELRAGARDTVSYLGSLDWDAMTAPAPTWAETLGTHLYPIHEGSLHTGHGLTDATEWMDDLAPDSVPDTEMTARMRAQATLWYTTEVWEPVKADPGEFAVQSRNAAVRAGSIAGLASEAAQSVFLEQVAHLVSRDGIMVESEWGTDPMRPGPSPTVPTYVSDGRDSLPVGVDPAKAETHDDSPDSTGKDPKTKTDAGVQQSLSEGSPPEGDHSESVENPLTGDTSLDKSKGEYGTDKTDRMLTQGGYDPGRYHLAGGYGGGSPKEGDTAKCHKDNGNIQFFDGQWMHLNDGTGSDHNDVYPATPKEQADKDKASKSSSVTADSHTPCPIYPGQSYNTSSGDCSCGSNHRRWANPNNPGGMRPRPVSNPNRSQVANRHLAGSVNDLTGIGTCSVCGDSIAKDPRGENPSTWHHDNGSKHDHEAKPGSSGNKAASAKTAISLTHVGVDPATGNGQGTTSDGHRVTFRLTDKERADLKAVLYSDLAINFAGVDVDPGDIIDLVAFEQGVGHLTGSLLDIDAQLAEVFSRPYGSIETYSTQTYADVLRSDRGLGEGIDEGDSPEGDHSEPATQEQGQGANDASTGTDADRPDGGINWGAGGGAAKDQTGAYTSSLTGSRVTASDMYYEMKCPKCGLQSTNYIDRYDHCENCGTAINIKEHGAGADAHRKQTALDSSSLPNLTGNARVFVATLEQMSSLDDEIDGITGHQVAHLLAREPGIPDSLREALRGGDNPFSAGRTAAEGGDYERGKAAGQADHSGSTDLSDKKQTDTWANASEEWKRGWSDGYESEASKTSAKQAAEGTCNKAKMMGAGRWANCVLPKGHEGSHDFQKSGSKQAATEGPWKAQVAGLGEMVWSENAIRFQTPEEAKASIDDLALCWFGFDLGRVVPSDTPNREPVDLADPQITNNYRTGSKTAASTAKPGEVKHIDNGAYQRSTCQNCGTGIRRKNQMSSGWTHARTNTKFCPESKTSAKQAGKSNGTTYDGPGDLPKPGDKVEGRGGYIGNDDTKDVKVVSVDGPYGPFSGRYHWDVKVDAQDGSKPYSQTWFTKSDAKQSGLLATVAANIDSVTTSVTAKPRGNSFSISDAKNEDGEWTMSPEQIRAEMAYDPSEDYDPDDYYEASLKRIAAEGPRPLYEIAEEIRRVWRPVFYGAVPYLDAMSQLDTMDDHYYNDPARHVVAYFLSNTRTWKGDDARRIKAELRAMQTRR